MKNTKKCSKCQSTDIARIAGQDRNQIFLGMSALNSALVTHFVCLDCGYSEEWIESKEDLERIRKKFTWKT